MMTQTDDPLQGIRLGIVNGGPDATRMCLHGVYTAIYFESGVPQKYLNWLEPGAGVEPATY
jgi:hypothetical protein